MKSLTHLSLRSLSRFAPLRTLRPWWQAALLPLPLAAGVVFAADGQRLDSVVVSANRSEQTRFDAAASIDAVRVDNLRAASPLVNLSELTQAIPGIQVRERQNYAQDLQLSVRGFGTRATFGVRGVRLLVDGIPATQPDGQGQAATAILTSTERIEVLRGPVAQLYGNAAGGVVQVFSKNPPLGSGPTASASFGAGSYGQRQMGATIAGGGEMLGLLLDVNQFETDGYREHSAARRTQVNGKILLKPSSATTITGVLNSFNQPLSQDPVGLSRAQFEANPRQAITETSTFDTRKTIEQHQFGLLAEHKLNTEDRLNARIYTGTRKVFQTLSFRGNGATSAGGVVDLDNTYRGVGLSWTRATKLNGMPLSWTVGTEVDALDQRRKGFVNEFGTPGDLRRNELDEATNVDYFGQIDWTFHPQFKASAGVRTSRVTLSVDDDFGADDSGSVTFRNTSPVVGLTWFAQDNVNVYANLGRGFETPTLNEIAYRAGANGTNFALRASRSVQSEIGIKWRGEHQSLDVAVFNADSKNEITPQLVSNGRTVFQNVDKVRRRGLEINWQTRASRFGTQLGYTLLDATFERPFTSLGRTIAAGNRLPGAPEHSLFGRVEYRTPEKLTLGLESRIESKAYVNDVNSDAASGYATFNATAAQEFRVGGATWVLFGRVDNIGDRKYAGSVIVNDTNERYFEPAPERRFFVGVRASL